MSIANIKVPNIQNLYANSLTVKTVTADTYAGSTSPFDLSSVIHITNTTPATSVSTGALIVDGGCSITKKLYAKGGLYTTSGTGIPAYSLSEYGLFKEDTNDLVLETPDSNVSGLIRGVRCQDGYNTNFYTSKTNTIVQKGFFKVFDTTNSTSMSTGSIIVNGGVGIAKSLFTNNLNLQSNLYFNNHNVDIGDGTSHNNIPMPLGYYIEFGGIYTSPVTLTGFAGGEPGRVVVLFGGNASSSIIIAHESGSSSPANRIRTMTGADITLTVAECCVITLLYDGLNARWRMVQYRSS